MAKNRKYLDQNGNPSRDVRQSGSATAVKFHSPLVGDDCETVLQNLIEEMRQRPSGTAISISMMVHHWALQLQEKLRDDPFDIDLVVREAIALGINVERARNETYRMDGKAKAKITDEELPEALSKVEALMKSQEIKYTPATDEVAQQYGMVGGSLRQRLKRIRQ